MARDALGVLADAPLSVDLRCHGENHSCLSYDLDAAFEFGDNSYKNRSCLRSRYWRPLVRALSASGEMVIDNKTF